MSSRRRDPSDATTSMQLPPISWIGRWTVSRTFTVEEAEEFVQGRGASATGYGNGLPWSIRRVLKTSCASARRRHAHTPTQPQPKQCEKARWVASTGSIEAASAQKDCSMVGTSPTCLT